MEREKIETKLIYTYHILYITIKCIQRLKLFSLVEESAGRQLTEAERKAIVHGAEEADLVYSGLEDTMIQACEETRQTSNLKNVDYRTAAYINAIQKIAAVYEGSGMLFMH